MKTSTKRMLKLGRITVGFPITTFRMENNFYICKEYGKVLLIIQWWQLAPASV